MDIYLSTWCIRDRIISGKLLFPDLPQFAIQHGFSGIEIMDRQICNFNSEFLIAFYEKCKNLGCKVILDISSDLTRLNDDRWMRQLQYAQNMIYTAEKINASKVRIVLGGQTISFEKIFNFFRKRTHKHDSNQINDSIIKKLLQSLQNDKILIRLSHFIRRNGPGKVRHEKQKLNRAIKAIRQLVPIAKKLQIPLVIENHWGISSRPENILTIMSSINSPFLGTCPDFGNFPRSIDLYQALDALIPKAYHVHAKSYRFDEQGNEVRVDYGKCMAILQKHGYNDSICVEYEGTGDSLEGCLRTKQLITKLVNG